MIDCFNDNSTFLFLDLWLSNRTQENNPPFYATELFENVVMGVMSDFKKILRHFRPLLFLNPGKLTYGSHI